MKDDSISSSRLRAERQRLHSARFVPTRLDGRFQFRKNLLREHRIPTRNAYTEDRLTLDNILGLKISLTGTMCTTPARSLEDYRRKRWIATARKATSKNAGCPDR